MVVEVNKKFSPEKISDLLNHHYTSLMKEFYEMQCIFLGTHYKTHQNIETSNIMTSLVRSVHLAIIRQRERDLDHDISLNNFFSNIKKLNNSETITHKIISIVKITGIPKETVRRKLKRLMQREFVIANKNKEYYLNIAKHNSREMKNEKTI